MLPNGPGTDLPVRAVLPELLDALEGAGGAVLVAPPGTGKTTLVPLALAATVEGRVVVAEPRRVAARAAARRMAALLGEDVGRRVGYSVRGDSRRSAATRIEVVTTGLLLRRLQQDPELPGTAVLVLDEVHERHLDADLALAFALDVRGVLRPDLRLLATSATAQAGPLADLLGAGSGSPAPVVAATVPVHPLTVRWAPPPRPVPPPQGLRVDPGLLTHVAAVARTALAEHAGDVLVFLPGTGEIEAVRRDLAAGAGVDADLVVLHGRLPAAAQDAALTPGPRRRVVLATAVAESSITVPGVRVVVDSGLSRVPRTDHARGLSGLDTVRVSRAGAEQRAGRAAREGAGVVLRCWSPGEHDLLPAHPAPEISTADLAAFALAAACWGAPGARGLALLDPPPPGPLSAATDVLRRLGALDGAGAVTPAGRRMASVGLHPRLARALLEGWRSAGPRAVEVVALLAADGLLPGGGDDLTAEWRLLRRGGGRRGEVWRQEVQRLQRELGGAAAGPPGRDGGTDDAVAGTVVALAHPERIARLRPGREAYAMLGGTGARPAPGSAWTGAPWLAVALADRPAGRADARILSAAPLDEETARAVAAAEVVVEDEVRWGDGDVRSRRVERLGAIVLRERALESPSGAAVRSALADGVRSEGLGVLSWSAAATGLRERIALCRNAFGDRWPDVSDAALLAGAEEWLGSELAAARGRADLRRIDVTAALRRMLPWPEAARLDALAPERIEVPSGGRVRVDYADPAAPVLAVKLQEAFGWAQGPRVADGRVPVVVHLLSPAGRPLAVTSDLASFWQGAYRQVRAEMRGRYPRHPWPEDPWTAPATRRLNERRG
ncbi:ATP-dependent helicase HrpB [Kineococcus xinjiangensis]|uniref:ATP-dependent helicase HrpB n=1 Tax=Kineococcus xinjiangensis TaxID=512762 RepID=A0A2S6IWR1_9ACTN|nr:ATP-dependent helicase HrpB [Kineococcus xinjiangensis]PPK98680.1 ATP-dependent helicase HrpB [Kineococcus xinjiangensis]